MDLRKQFAGKRWLHCTQLWLPMACSGWKYQNARFLSLSSVSNFYTYCSSILVMSMPFVIPSSPDAVPFLLQNIEPAALVLLKR